MPLPRGCRRPCGRRRSTRTLGRRSRSWPELAQLVAALLGQLGLAVLLDRGGRPTWPRTPRLPPYRHRGHRATAQTGPADSVRRADQLIGVRAGAGLAGADQMRRDLGRVVARPWLPATPHPDRPRWTGRPSSRPRSSCGPRMFAAWVCWVIEAQLVRLGHRRLRACCRTTGRCAVHPDRACRSRRACARAYAVPAMPPGQAARTRQHRPTSIDRAADLTADRLELGPPSCPQSRRARRGNSLAADQPPTAGVGRAGVLLAEHVGLGPSARANAAGSFLPLGLWPFLGGNVPLHSFFGAGLLSGSTVRVRVLLGVLAVDELVCPDVLHVNAGVEMSLVLLIGSLGPRASPGRRRACPPW